ncbi:MAG TPA: cyclic nucleotide-binding domain-containing protein, partial [Pseudomonadales bacterium]
MIVRELLERTGLFSSLSADEIGALAQSVDVVELPAGWEFIREGDEGDYLYAVLDGALQVFTHGRDGREIVLDRCGAGEYVGEQALLPGRERRRNASVRTSERSTLARIAREDFQAVLEKDNPLREELLGKAIDQARSILARQSAVFGSLDLGDSSDWSDEKTFADGEVIFSQGDAGDFYYLIRSGSVAIYRETNGRRERLAQLGAGQGFGELALLKRTPRQATAVAEGNVLAVRIDGASFRILYEARPELREYVQTLQNVYALRGHGLITQHTGRFLDQDSITTLFHLDDGTRAASSFVIGRDIFDMRFLPEENVRGDSLRYRDPSAGIDRELVLAGDRVVAVTSYGPWEELGTVQRMMLEREAMSDERRANFCRMGRLSPQVELISSESDVVCECMQTTYGTILEAISGSAATLEEVTARLACGTVCGGCRPRIREILGEGGWTPVAVSEEFEVLPGIRSFRLKSYGKPFAESLPGQHIVIRAPIDQRWVQRPYTLTSPGGAKLDYREVTIKRERGGQFSRWMFGDRDGGTVLQVSEPRGDFHVDLDRTEPVVCLV